MKTTLSLFAVAAMTAFAAPSFAQETVELSGHAESYCHLPTSWAFVSAGGGGAAGQFSGTTWSIPSSMVADTSSNAVLGAEVAIRIRGDGSCNTSHTIQLHSSRGGLAAGSDPSQPAPDGFLRRRVMKYDAHWVTGDGVSGAAGVSNFRPTTPGQASNAFNYVVSGSKAAPGNRGFDIRMGLERGPTTAGVLIAGQYSDQLTVTISIAP